MERLQKRADVLEKLQVRLSEIENTKDALSAAVESKLEERLKFLDVTLRQKTESMEAAVLEKSRSSDAKISGEIAGMRKELSSLQDSSDDTRGRTESLSKDFAALKNQADNEKIKTSEVTRFAARLQDSQNGIEKLDEKIKTFEGEKDELVKSVSSLAALKQDFSKLDERTRNLDAETSKLRSNFVSVMNEIQSRVDKTSSEGTEKFGSAVKAFLTSRAEMGSKITNLDLRLSEQDKRISDFSRITTRLDLLEKRIERLGEKHSDLEKDVVSIGKKGSAEEKITLIDLGSGE